MAALYSTTLPQGPVDDIIIGSGVGGMVLAGLLSRFGRRVAVLEQHYVPGGVTHSFRRHQHRWNVGVHVIGEVTPRSIGGAVLNGLCDTPIEWLSVGENYDRIEFPDETVEIPASRDAYIQALRERFPEDVDAIEAYFASLRRAGLHAIYNFVYRCLPWHGRWATWFWYRRGVRSDVTTTTAELVEGLTRNPRLQRLLTAQWGYYGTPPSQSSFAAHALVMQHFAAGGHYPKGGGSILAERLLTPVVAAGGSVTTRAEVEEILVRSGAAVGVRLRDGRELLAQNVFSNAGAHGTLALLPPTPRLAAWRQRLKSLPASMGHITLYLGFDRSPSELGCGNGNLWVYRREHHDVSSLPFPATHYDPIGFWFSSGSLKDPQHHRDGTGHVAQAISFVPSEWFAPYFSGRPRHRSPEYEALKERLQDGLLAAVLERFPEFKGHLTHVELSTPASTAHYTRRPAGSIYGLAATAERLWTTSLRPRTPVRRLFLTGADVAVVGVVGALAGAIMAAFSAFPFRTMHQLWRMFRPPPEGTDPAAT